VNDQEVLAREREWVRAIQFRDTESLNDVLDDEFTLISWASGGEKLTKADYIADLNGVELISCAIRDCITQIFDSTAVVRCLLVWQARVAGQTWNSEFLITDVWVRRREKWRVVARHASLPCSGDAPRPRLAPVANK
jgi:hypothetical protein